MKEPLIATLRPPLLVRFPALAALLVFSSLAGCVVVPYTPSASTTRTPCPSQVEEGIYVTIGPRKLLEDVAQMLKENAPSIVLVGGLEFRDAAFADGNWTLERLLAAESGCRGLPLPADYLVLIGRPQYATVKKKGEVVFYYGFLGLTKADEAGDFSALVVDLENCRPVTIVTASAEGSMVGAGLFYGLFVYPRIGESVLRGLGQGVAEVLTEARPAGPLRVVVMAAETQEQTNFLEQGRQPKD